MQTQKIKSSPVRIKKLHTQAEYRWLVYHRMNPKMNGSVVIGGNSSKRILPEITFGTNEEYLLVMKTLEQIISHPKRFI